MKSKLKVYKVPEIGRMAFWPYDLFPFVLSSNIVEVKERSFRTQSFGWHNVECRDYDGPYATKLSKDKIAYVAHDEGVAIHDGLMALTAEFRLAKAALLNDFQRKALMLAPFLPQVNTSAFDEVDTSMLVETPENVILAVSNTHKKLAADDPTTSAELEQYVQALTPVAAMLSQLGPELLLSTREVRRCVQHAQTLLQVRKEHEKRR